MKKHISYLALFAIAAMFVFGCAGTKVKHWDAVKNKKQNGFRLYEPKPYLWVTFDSAGKNLIYKLIYLPDRSKPIYVIPKRGFGTGETTFKTADGWLLTEFGSKSDSKIPETISAAGDVLTGIAGIVAAKNGVGGEAALTEKNDKQGLYELIFDSLGSVSSFKLVLNYPATLPEKDDCESCQCEYEGKKYSEGAMILFNDSTSKKKQVMQCKDSKWTAL